MSVWDEPRRRQKRLDEAKALINDGALGGTQVESAESLLKDISAWAKPDVVGSLGEIVNRERGAKDSGLRKRTAAQLARLQVSPNIKDAVKSTTLLSAPAVQSTLLG